MKTTLSMGMAAVIVTLTSGALAQDMYDITVGDNASFDTMNHHDSTTGADPGNPNKALPQAGNLEATSAGGSAMAKVIAGNDQAGVASARLGIKYDFLLPAGKSWDQVKDDAVYVTIKLDYDLSTKFDQGSGSANAGLAIRPLTSGPWYRFIGYADGQTGGAENAGVEQPITLRFRSTPQQLGGMLELEVMAQAHANAATNEAQASVNVQSISLDFAPVKTFTARYQSKLFIRDIGWFDCGNPNFLNPAEYTPTAFMARRAAYQAFCQAGSLGENPPTGANIEPLDARVMGGVEMKFQCEAGKTTPVWSDITALPGNAGWEGPLKASPAPTAIRDNLTTSGSFGYVVSGAPHILTEPAFQAFAFRTNRSPWQHITGTVTCGTNADGHPTASGTTRLVRSPFPSHKTWINGTLRFDERQGLFSGLWSLPAVPAP